MLEAAKRHSTYHWNDWNYQNMKISASDDKDGLQNPDKNAKAERLESLSRKI